MQVVFTMCVPAILLMHCIEKNVRTKVQIKTCFLVISAVNIGTNWNLILQTCSQTIQELFLSYYLQQCDDFPEKYGAPQKTVCRTWFESECNTTYVESPSGDHKPNTWCQKMPRKICAPDNCNMVQVIK